MDSINRIQLVSRTQTTEFQHQGDFFRHGSLWCPLTRDSTDQQYQDFFSEVDNLRGLLEELDVSLRNAHNRFIESGNNAAGMGAHDPLAFDFDNERKKIVGDFNDTLLACRAVLIRYSHLQNVSASVVQNLTW